MNHMPPGPLGIQLLQIGTPLAKIELEENVEPFRTGVAVETMVQEAIGVIVAGRQEALFKADSEELWISFRNADVDERSEIVFRAYGRGIKEFSYGSNVAFERA
jgi:hypothetical protein